MNKNKLFVIGLILTLVMVWGPKSSGEVKGYGGSLKYGETELKKLIGGTFEVTPDTPITVTAFHEHGVHVIWIGLSRVKPVRLIRDNTRPKELSGTFTLREKFGITKPGRYTFTARGYQKTGPDGKMLGPRPFYFIKSRVDIVVPEGSVVDNDTGMKKDGWKSSGPGAGWGSPDWQMVRGTFKSGQYSYLAVVLINSSNGPLAWFDDIKIEGLNIINPGFEDMSGPDRFVGWEGRLWLPWNSKYHSLKEHLHMFASPESRTGKKSIQITAPKRDAFLVRQRVTCKPNTDYNVSCWMRCSMGKGRLEVYGLKESEELKNVRYGKNIDQTVKRNAGARLVTIGAPPARLDLGKHVIQIDKPGTKMSKRFVAGRSMPFLLDFDVMIQSSPDRMFYGTTMRNFPYPVPTKAEKATAIVRVLDTRGRLLKEVSADVSTPVAFPIRVKGFAGSSGEVIVELSKSGGGVVRFGNVRLGSPDATVAIRSAKWQARNKAFVFPKNCTYRIDSKFKNVKTSSGLDLLSAIDLLREDMSRETEFSPVKAGRKASINIIFDKRIKGEEDYRIEAGNKGIKIMASRGRGAFYGVVTLMDLLVHEKESWIIPGGSIDDGPDLPVRWFRSIHTFKKDSPERNKILARLKFNGATTCQGTQLIAGGPGQRGVLPLDKLLETIEVARRCGVSCIPMPQNTGHAELAELWTDPNVAEGTAVEGEKIVLNGQDPKRLKQSNVIQTETRRIELRDPNGKLYEKGRDFRVIAKPLKFKFFDGNARPRTGPPAVARTENSRIPDGGMVVASYDYVARHPHYSKVSSRCLTDPHGYEIVEQYIKLVLSSIPPVSYIHLVHDEPLSYLHLEDGKWVWKVTCRSCLASGKSFGQLYAENVNRLLKTVKEVSPQTDVVIWSDTQNNPEHDPEAMKFLKHLSKEVILNPWYYGRNKNELGAVEGWRDIKVFSRMGFRSMGCPGMFNIENVRGWCQAGYEARKRGWPFLGIFFYAGGGYQGKGAMGIPAAGRFSWRVPKGWIPPDVPAEKKVNY